MTLQRCVWLAGVVWMLGATTTQAAEIYVRAQITPTGGMSVQTSDGRTVIVEREQNETAFEEARIAPHGSAVAWLATEANCCTSYDIPRVLLLYHEGHVDRLRGNDLLISEWAFQKDGRAIAMRQETVHSGLGIHYELISVSTAKVLEVFEPRYDPDGRSLRTQRIPGWVKQLDHQTSH